jgi:hypothetical protein
MTRAFFCDFAESRLVPVAMWTGSAHVVRLCWASTCRQANMRAFTACDSIWIAPAFIRTCNKPTRVACMPVMTGTGCDGTSEVMIDQQHQAPCWHLALPGTLLNTDL